MSELLDARGVVIEPGDVCLYGFGVSRSVAMAEGEVVGEVSPTGWTDDIVSLTDSGLVRVRVVRRSYRSGYQKIVALMPDRLVVLKGAYNGTVQALPVSPLPTQDEKAREKLRKDIEHYGEGLRATVAPDYWEGGLDDYRDFCEKRLKQTTAKLRRLDG